MALRKLISNAVLPNLERDLNIVLGNKLAAAEDMVSNFLAPQVYGYSEHRPATGPFTTTEPRSSPDIQRLTKITYPAPKQGLFED